MSATLDAAPVALLMGEAPVVTSEGRAFTVETRWLSRSVDAQARFEAVMAAAKATLTEACTRENIDAAIALNHQLVEACQKIIDDTGIPAHTVEFGAKGCITWSKDPVRNYRDYKATDFDLAFAQWMHGINRGILLPPGLDEQWLISVMHSEADAMKYADVFAEFVAELLA